AGQHDGANVIAARQVAEMLGQLMANRGIERVLDLGAVDANDGDAVGGNVQQDDWIGDLAHVCSGWDHAAMSAMRNCVSRFRQMIGSKFVFCKCHSSDLRLWSSETAAIWPANRGKSAKLAALAQCPPCGIQFRKFDFRKMEALPCSARSGIGPLSRRPVRTSNGCCSTRCPPSKRRKRTASSSRRWPVAWSCCAASARARAC